MNRRSFLAGLLAAPAVTYFDMGASWKKHEALWVPEWQLCGRAGDVFALDETATALLKQLYDQKTVQQLTYDGIPIFAFVDDTFK